MKNIVIALVFALSAIVATANDTTFYFTTSDAVKLYVRMAGQGEHCLLFTAALVVQVIILKQCLLLS